MFDYKNFQRVTQSSYDMNHNIWTISYGLYKHCDHDMGTQVANWERSLNSLI